MEARERYLEGQAIQEAREEAKKQERERIFKEIEKYLLDSDDENMYWLSKNFWQALKKKEGIEGD